MLESCLSVKCKVGYDHGDPKIIWNQAKQLDQQTSVTSLVWSTLRAFMLSINAVALRTIGCCRAPALRRHLPRIWRVVQPVPPPPYPASLNLRLYFSFRTFFDGSRVLLCLLPIVSNWRRKTYTGFRVRSRVIPNVVFIRRATLWSQGSLLQGAKSAHLPTNSRSS